MRDMKQGWEIKKLTDVCSIQYGCAFDSSLFSDSSEDGMPLIRIRDIKDGYSNTYYKGSYADEYVIHRGDYLIGMDGEFNIEPWKSEDALLNQRVCKIESKLMDVSIRFIYRFLKKELKRIEDETPFVTVKHLSAKRLNQVVLDIPPLPEQEKIVSELDCLSGIIEKKRQQLKELDALAQSIFYEMFGDPVTNEKGWEVKKLGEVCSLKAGKSIKASELSSSLSEGLYPCFGGNGIRGYIAKVSHKSIFPIIGRQGALCGNVVMSTEEFYATEHAVVVQPLIDMNISWLYSTLKFMNLNRLAQGVAQPGLSVGKVSEEYLPLPPLPLQQTFASKVESIEKQKELIKQSLGEVETLFNSRMDFYFN